MNKEVNNIIKDSKLIYQKLEIINKNFKETNKFLIKVNELDKIVKEIINQKNEE